MTEFYFFIVVLIFIGILAIHANWIRKGKGSTMLIENNDDIEY